MHQSVFLGLCPTAISRGAWCNPDFLVSWGIGTYSLSDPYPHIPHLYERRLLILSIYRTAHIRLLDNFNSWTLALSFYLSLTETCVSIRKRWNNKQKLLMRVASILAAASVNGLLFVNIFLTSRRSLNVEDRYWSDIQMASKSFKNEIHFLARPHCNMFLQSFAISTKS